MNFINFSQNLSTANFNKFSAISKINTFYEKLIWSDVIILQETVVFKIRFSRIKSEILLKFVLSWVPFVCFNLLLYSTYYCILFWPCFYYLIIASDLCFHDVLPTVSCGHQKVTEWSACIKNLCYKCYNNLFIKLLYAKLALNWINIKEVKKYVQMAFDLTKGQPQKSPYVNKFDIKLNKQ